MDLFKLVATLGLDTREFEIGVTKSQGLFGKLGSTVSAGTIAMGNLMADAVKKGASMVIDLGKTGIAYNAQMEDYTSNFKVMLGSTEAAAEKVESLKKMAAQTPFEMGDLASATQTLLAFGIEADKTDGIMKMLGDVSLGNSQKFSSLATVFGQVSSTGKLMGQDLLQFINQGFNPLQVLAEKTGVSIGDLKNVMSGDKTSREFRNMVKAAQKEVKKMGDNASESAKLLAQIGTDGEISAEMVAKAFEIATSEGGQFYNGMEEASKTFNGQMSTLSDNWTGLVGKVFTPVSDYMTQTLLPNAIGVVDKLSEAYDSGGILGMATEIANIVGPLLGGAFETVATYAQNAIDTGAGVIAGIYNGLTGGEVTADDVKLFFSDMWGSASDAASQILNSSASLLGDIYTMITGDTESGQKIEDAIKSIFENPMGAIGDLISKGKTLFSDLFGAISGDQESQGKIQEQISGVFSGLLSYVDLTATQAGAIFSDIAEALTGDSESAELIKTTFANVFDNPIESFKTLVSKGGSLLSDIALVLGADEGSATVIGEAFTSFFENPFGTIASLVEAGQGIIGNITSAFADEQKRAELIEAVKGAFTETVEYISSLPAKALEWGKDLIKNFVDGILKKWEELKSKISGIADTVSGWFDFGWFGGDEDGGRGAGRNFAVGKDYVPRDNYVANLHRGEAVLTRSEAEDWRARRGARPTITVIQNIYSEAKTAAELMEEARWAQERAVLGYV